MEIVDELYDSFNNLLEKEKSISAYRVDFAPLLGFGLAIPFSYYSSLRIFGSVEPGVFFIATTKGEDSSSLGSKSDGYNAFNGFCDFNLGVQLRLMKSFGLTAKYTYEIALDIGNSNLYTFAINMLE